MASFHEAEESGSNLISPRAEKSALRKERVRRSQKPKLKVAWREIDGACAEIVTMEARASWKPEDSVKLTFIESPTGGKCTSAVTRLCNTITEPCRNMMIPRECRPEMYGYLWKLNSSADQGRKGLARMDSWRRRLFFLKESQGKLALTYISEKENGVMQLACILSGRAAAATVSAVPPVDLDPIPAQELRGICVQLHQYDLAFAENMVCSESEYEDQVPRKFYAFSIKWTDASNIERKLVLSSPSEGEALSWWYAIEKVSPGCLAGPKAS